MRRVRSSLSAPARAPRVFSRAPEWHHALLGFPEDHSGIKHGRQQQPAAGVAEPAREESNSTTHQDMPFWAPPPISALFSVVIGASALLAGVSALRGCDPQLATKMLEQMRPCWAPALLSPERRASCTASGAWACAKDTALQCTHGCECCASWTAAGKCYNVENCVFPSAAHLYPPCATMICLERSVFDAHHTFLGNAVATPAGRVVAYGLFPGLASTVLLLFALEARCCCIGVLISY